MQNISVYLNSRASHGENEWENKINSALFRSNIEYRKPSDLNELYTNLKKDIEQNVDAVLSVGGDGTVNTIIQLLAGTEIGLLVVPGGTANDFANTLGSSHNIKKISQAIRLDTKKKIDLISINGQFMATNGGIGFASEVAKEINNLRREFPHFKKIMQISGKNVYNLFLAKNLLTKNIEIYKLRIKCESFDEIIHSPLVLINNQPILGGSYQIAPHTNHADGKFNLTIFKHTNRLELISSLVKIFNNNYPYDDKNILSFEVESATIELLEDKKLSFFGDGEILAEGNIWDIKLYPSFLTVFSPKDQLDLSSFCTKVSLF